MASPAPDPSELSPAHESNFMSGVVLAITGTFLFALKSIIIKLAFAAGADADIVLTYRMILSLPFYAAVLMFDTRKQTGRERLTRKQILTAMGLGFLGYYLASLLDLKGLELISAQLERLTLFTYPAMIAILAWMFLGEKITLNIIFAILLCYLGIFYMYSQEVTFEGSENTTRGVALVVGSAISYSCYVVLAKALMQVIGSRRFTSLAMIGSTVFVMIHFFATNPVSDLYISWTVGTYCLVLAIVCTVLPSYLVNEAIVRIGATRTTIIGTVGPVMTMLLAIAILGEPTSRWHIFGMIMVIIGVRLVAENRNET
ncbi:MAG: DMT family transporter [Planctomycetota bacterium]